MPTTILFILIPDMLIEAVVGLSRKKNGEGWFMWDKTGMGRLEQDQVGQVAK